MRCLLYALLGVVFFTTSCGAQWVGANKDQGFLCNPPVYVSNEPDIPLTALSVLHPKPGEIVPDVDVSGLDAEQWNVDGNNVQPGLEVDFSWIRVSALRGFNGGWSAGLSIPWYRNKVIGEIGGSPASGVAEGFGNVTLLGRKVLWEDCTTGRRFTAAFGIDLPVGSDDQSFGPDNAVTNGYFSSGRRIPLGWQPSSGTWNGIAGLAYGRSMGRFSWLAFTGGKLYGRNDEDVKIGNVLIAGLNGTYGFSRDLAGSLGFTMRAQADDDYPNSPLPVNGPLLQGTTNHGTVVYLDAAVRYTLFKKLTVGVGVRQPIMDPDDGMVTETQFSLIFYPNVTSE